MTNPNGHPKNHPDYLEWLHEDRNKIHHQLQKQKKSMGQWIREEMETLSSTEKARIQSYESYRKCPSHR